MSSVNDKVAIVFGAGMPATWHGKGSAIAARLSREGGRVIALDRHPAASERFRALITQGGGQCVAYQADVRHADLVSAAVEFAIQEFRQIDVLVNNVGIASIGGAGELSIEVRDQLGKTDAISVEHLMATRNSVCPTGAMGTPEDAAATQAFLASDDAHYINGTEIVVDGGLHNQCFAAKRA